LRSVLDTAEFELKGVRSVVFVEPSWFNQAKLIARSSGLSEKRVQALPLGSVTANSIDALPLIKAHIGEIIAGIEQALQ
jgi:hypothetical protein